jgi:hypothetical protein
MSTGSRKEVALAGLSGVTCKLLLTRDGSVLVRVWHEQLTEHGEEGIDTLVALKPQAVEVAHAGEQDAPSARAVVATLRARGIEAYAGTV